MIHKYKIIFLATCVCYVRPATSTDGDDQKIEKFFQKHLNRFLPKPTVDHILHSANGRRHEEFVAGAYKASNLYRLELSSVKSPTGDFRDTLCYQQVMKIRNDVAASVPYATFIDDSNGREESGLYQGNYQWFGRYYECVGQTDRIDITAKMCLVIFVDDQTKLSGLRVGQCVPDVCTEEDISQLNNLVLPANQSAVADCPDELPFTAADIILIVLLSVFGILVITGTILDIVPSRKTAGVWSNVLICFSVIKNTRGLFQTKRKDSSIPVIDGIRFLSMTWVVLGHTYTVAIGYTDNLLDHARWYLSHFGLQAIANATLSVDSFFFLSGLLVTYLALRKMKSTGGKLNVPLMYLQRYLRLTPTLIFAILFATGLFQKIGDGLRFQRNNQAIATYCQEWWWTNLLYINNLVPNNFGESCISWTWYLANDMQFFIVAPIFIYMLYRYPKAGLVSLGIGVLGSSAITGALSRHFELITDVYIFSAFFRLMIFLTYPLSLLPTINIPSYMEATEDIETDPYFDDVYNRPWCRIGVYFIGMLTGYILHVTNKRVKIRKIFVIMLWVLVIAVELAVMYGWWGRIDESQYPEYPTYNVMAFYEAVRRPLWGFGLMWITIACTSGYGGPLNAFLSWKMFVPLSRLTYSTYMFHIFVLQFMFTSIEVEPHVRLNVFIYYFLAALVLSMSVGFIVYLVIEAPIVELQKILFSKPAETKSKPNPTICMETRNSSIPVISTRGVVEGAETNSVIMGIRNEVDVTDETNSDGTRV